MPNRLKGLLWSPVNAHNYLLVVFFVMYRGTQAFFFLRLTELVITTIVLFLLVFLANKLVVVIFSNKKPVAAVFLTLLLIPSLFFTTVVDLLKRAGLVDIVQWNRETILILVVCWIVVLAFILRTKKGFTRFCQYLKTLFAILLLYQALVFFLRIGTLRETKLKLDVARQAAVLPVNLKPKEPLPDIYFLIFDAYTGNAGLRNEWNFNNQWITKDLQKKNFHVSDSAISGYDYTQVCISSIFNMNFQVNWQKVLGDSYWAMTEYLNQIRNNQLSEILEEFGYKEFNFSFFEINDQPVFTSFKPYSPTRNFFRFVLENSILLRFFNNPFNAEQGKNNLKIYQGVVETARSDRSRKFVYGHFMLPHPAYFFDSSGKYFENGRGKFKSEYENYLEQLKYTNGLIAKMTDSILHYRPNSVILIQGDHGSRLIKSTEGKLIGGESLQPFCAVYFPGHDYHSIKEPFFTLNTFRVVLNKYFSAPLEMLPSKTNHYLLLK